MINITITLFTFVLLISLKVLLLNEESLILLCFIMFIWLSFNNLNTTINNSFLTQSNQIEMSLKSSLKDVITSLNNFNVLRDSLKEISNKFQILNLYYRDFVIYVTNLTSNFRKSFLIQSYKKRLTFLTKVESQTSKLLLTLLLKKTTQISQSKKFYKSIIKTNKFLTLNKIQLRESICSIKIKE